MVTVPSAFLAAYEPDNVQSLIRAAIMFGGIGVTALVWLWVQRRMAPRTIASWAGIGVNEDLSRAAAALLIRRSPGTIGAALVVELVRARRMTIEGIRPLRLAWTEREGPSNGIEEALDAAFVTGAGDADLAQTVLDRLQETVTEKMGPFSGRGTAVYYRRRVESVRLGLRKGDPGSGEDRLWLMLDDQTRLWDCAGEDRAGEEVRDLIRFVGLFERWFLSSDEITRRANRGEPGFFSFRKDLRRHRGPIQALTPAVEVSERPTGIFGATLDGLARALDGEVRMDGGVWIPISFLSVKGPAARVLGRHRGRVVSLDFWSSEFEVTLVVTADESSVGEVEDTRLEPRIWLAVEPKRIVYVAPFDRARDRAKEILKRLDALSDLADEHET